MLEHCAGLGPQTGSSTDGVYAALHGAWGSDRTSRRKAPQALPSQKALDLLRAVARLNSAENETTSNEGKARVLVVSGSTAEQAWTSNVTRNQRLFSRLHGHDYAFVGAEASTSLLNDVASYQPQWLKIRILHGLLHQDRSWQLQHPFVLWIDDDIVVTHPQNFVQQMLQRLKPQEEMLIAKDAGDPSGKGINTGMMLLRSSAKAISILESIWSMSAERAPGGTLGTCKNQKCLHEQAAIDILRKRDIDFRSAVGVVEPVEDAFNMNTFYRKTHHDATRGMRLDYAADPDEFRWDPERSDLNTCHVTGMARNLRASMIEQCLEVAGRKFMKDVEQKLGGFTTLTSAFV
jgi:hypothetical protein